VSAVTDPVVATACVEVEALTRRHGDVLANDAITLRVEVGEVFGLLGPNGAGKTTLVRQLVGLLRPDAGRIAVLGRRLDRDLAGRAMAYLPQRDAALAELPVSLAIETTARLRGVGAAAARRERDGLLAELGLEALAARTPETLSGGQRRLAAVACALAGERPVLVLDEPTTGLDPSARQRVWTALERRRHERGATVVLVTHNVLEAETVLDRVAVLERGRLVACDTPGRLKASVSAEVRLQLVWRGEPPSDPLVAALRGRATVAGRRWTLHLPAAEARQALERLTTGATLAALDDFTLSTATLEDVYLTLGGRAADLERE
jgi:ABC-2 type transport system ATP-binding protein